MSTLLISCDDSLETCEPHTPGTLRACPGLCKDCLTFTFFTFKKMQNLFFHIIQKVNPLTRTFYMISVRNRLKLFTPIVFLTYILVDKTFYIYMISLSQ